jgi:hypothetical protein
MSNQDKPSDTSTDSEANQEPAPDDWACLDDLGDVARLVPTDTPGMWRLLDDLDLPPAAERESGIVHAPKILPQSRNYPEFYRYLGPSAALPDWLDHGARVAGLGIECASVERVVLCVDDVSRTLAPVVQSWFQQVAELPVQSRLLGGEPLESGADLSGTLVIALPGDAADPRWPGALRPLRRAGAQILAIVDETHWHPWRFVGQKLALKLPKPWPWYVCGAFSGHLFSLLALARRLTAERGDANAVGRSLASVARAAHRDVVRLPTGWTGVHSIAMDAVSAGCLALVGEAWEGDLCRIYAPLIANFAGITTTAAEPHSLLSFLQPKATIPVLGLADRQQLPAVVEQLNALPDASFRKILVTNADPEAAAIAKASVAQRPVPITAGETAPIGFALWLQMLTYQAGIQANASDW